MARTTKVLTEEEKDALLALGEANIALLTEFQTWLSSRRPGVAFLLGMAINWVKGLLAKEGV